MATTPDIINEISKKRNYESGHAKNVVNFDSLITVALSYNTSYNPSAEEIKIPALQALKTNLDNVITTVREAEAPYKNAVNARQLAFEGMSKLTTKIINALEACGVTKKEVKDGQSIAKKITGKRAKTIADKAPTTTEPTVEEVVKHSVSQLSFDSRVENFKKLLTYILGITKYTPNETELKTTTLNTYVNTLPTLNKTVDTTQNTLITARIARNKLLYNKITGAYDLSVQLKKYVKSVFGATSPEYKMISKIKLTDYSNK